MTYTRFDEANWGPFEDLRGLQREVGRFLEQFGCEGVSGREFPALNLWSNDESAVVTAELPGVDPSELEIRVVRDELTLRGKREQEEIPEGVTRHRSEQENGPFERTIRLPFEVEDSGVKATYRQGILRLTLPRMEASRPRTIKVETESD